MTGKTIRRYEKGQTTPDSTCVAEIAEVTDRPLAYFLPALPLESEEEPTPLTVDPVTPATLDAPRHLSPADTVDVVLTAIQGPRLVDTDETRPVPWGLLRHVDMAPDHLRLMKVPRRHYTLLRFLRPSNTLVLDPLDRPMPLDAYLRSGPFVDGQYVLGIGHASLQIKTVTAHPDDTITIESVDGTQRFRYQPEETSGVALHAAVVMSY
jgi:hypothetical protein